MQDKNIAISELKKLIDKCKGKSVDTKTSNVNVVCATCGKCVFNSNHDACVSKFLNDVNARTKKPNVVHISTRKPKKVKRHNSVLSTTNKKTVASESTTTNSKSYYRMLYKRTSKAWKWWIAQQCPSAYTWVLDNKGMGYTKDWNVVSLADCTVCFAMIHNVLNSGSWSFGLQGNIMINKVYYVEVLNRNLFLVGQLCDADLEDETPEVLKDFLMMIQRNLQALVISVRTDRGTEFLNKTLNAFFKEEGIEHQTSTPRTPEQNGVVERRNRTLVEAARTMLSASKLPLFFWAEAIATACYTQNRSIIIPTHEKTAYHIINDRKPSIKHLHSLWLYVLPNQRW
ncbi:retrovirus-related pol polyprotein from transposon TNT 1-94 [Tanacetum coccineum]